MNTRQQRLAGCYKSHQKMKEEQLKEWQCLSKMAYVRPDIAMTEMAMQGQLLQASAKGKHNTLPNGGTVYNNSGSSGGDAGTAEEDNVISNSKGYTLYEWD